MKPRPDKQDRNLFIGILAGIGAGMLFGTDFVPGQILKDISSLEFYFGRAFFFGLFSLLFCRRAIAAFIGFSARDKLHALALNAAGFWLYSLMLFWSIQNGSAIVTTIVVGTMPATIALASKNIRELGLLFILGLAIIFAGLCTLHAVSFSHLMDQGAAAWLLPFLCLGLWTWYAIANSTFIARHPQLSKTDMVSIMGLMTFVILMVLGIAAIDIPHILHHPQFNAYILWTAVLGIGSSWAGFWLWNICSLRCPPTISGPLLVSETMFGLIYTFLYQQRLPTVSEAFAIFLFAIGALLVIYTESRLDDAPA
ncbi:MAG: DMT family transporter [Alphaproteobacteria bacterium]